MRKQRMAALAVSAALVLAAAVGIASANKLSVSESTFRVIWGGAAEQLNVNASGLSIRCNVTLTGSFHARTFVKALRSRVGVIYQATRENCSLGNLYTILRETLPWSMNYEGFAGTLPRIERMDVTIVGAGILYHLSLIFREFLCLASFTRESPWLNRISIATGAATRWSTPSSTAPSLVPECNGISLEGTGLVSAASGGELRISLI
ncbi:MAG TPA: hypothetical protein VKB03_09700 [Conexibacter sp.]|nr:hypothetical protein [Conexibacter sp.]